MAVNPLMQDALLPQYSSLQRLGDTLSTLNISKHRVLYRETG